MKRLFYFGIGCLFLVVLVLILVEPLTAVPYNSPNAIPSSLAPQNNINASNLQRQEGCSEILINGDAEDDDGWEFLDSSSAPAVYSTDQAHSGSRSIRLGLTSGTNYYSYTYVRQDLIIPSDIESATFTFWLYRVSSPTSDPLVFQKSTQLTNPSDLTRGGAYPDQQMISAFDQDNGLLEWFVDSKENTETWQSFTFDLSAYPGQAMRFWLIVYNNGFDETTSMYFDDASLIVCTPQTPVPVHQTFLPTITKNNPTIQPSGPLMINNEWASQVIGQESNVVYYALTPSGLHRSNDRGLTWPISTPLPPITDSILMAPGQPSILFAGRGYDCQSGGENQPMWKSIDSGQSWVDMPGGLNLEPLAIHNSNSQRIYARGCDGPYLSNDGGETWQLQSSPLFNIYEIQHISPFTPDDWQTIYLGGTTQDNLGAIIKTSDGGLTWDISSPMQPSPFTINDLGPASIYGTFFIDDQGFWRTNDGGSSWYTNTVGLEDVIYDPNGPITQTYGLHTMSERFGYGIVIGTIEGLYHSHPDGWIKINGPIWQDDPIIDSLVTIYQSEKIFITTSEGVYILYRYNI